MIELLIKESEKNERLEAQLNDAVTALSSREIKIDKAGSIAEAALAVSDVFAAAEAAGAQYLENIRRLSEETERSCAEREAESAQRAGMIVAEAISRAEKMEADVRMRCEKMLELVGGELGRFRESVKNSF